MFEDILNNISSLTPFWIYVVLFFFSYLENVFPPSPSDLVVLIGGSLIGTGTISFIPTLILTTLGSVLGFMTLFILGTTVDKKLVRAGKVKMIPLEALERVENWFRNYGFWLILGNRFLPGTRSVISFFAGLSELNRKSTFVLALISAFLWNMIIIYIGSLFGKNVHIIDGYLSTYSNIIISLTIILVIFFSVRYFLRKKRDR
ncbi:MAG: DedA family protein [Ignavibacteriaceae bacterium]